jgi:hypothetical protein
MESELKATHQVLMIYNNFTSVQIVLILRLVLDIHYAEYRLKNDTQDSIKTGMFLIEHV